MAWEELILTVSLLYITSCTSHLHSIVNYNYCEWLGGPKAILIIYLGVTSQY